MVGLRDVGLSPPYLPDLASILCAMGWECLSARRLDRAAGGDSPDLQSILIFVLEASSDSRLVVSDSLQPHGPYSPWNSPVQNTGVGSLSLLQRSSQPRDRTQVSLMAGGFLTS